MWKTEGKRPLIRPTCKWKDNIKMCLEEMRWEGVDWFISLMLATGECDDKLSGSVKCGKMSRLAEVLSAFQAETCSMESV